MSAEKKSEVIIYKTPKGNTNIEVTLDGLSAWLSLNQIAELFQRDKSVISRHIKKVFDDKELDQKSVVA
ncbi:cell filamentation protein Fic, partial [bacterium]